MNNVTTILNALRACDPGAAAELFPIVYDELRQLAGRKVAHEKPGQSLNATALVHEAYLRLVDNQQFDGRGHFFAAAEAMRRILIESARRRGRLKRGGQRPRLELLDQAASLPEDPTLILSLEGLLTRLEAEDPAAAKIASLHLFGG
jgi:RNA polymerase sigma factor (TIGR02999 family)